MQPRATGTLAELPDEDLFLALAEGLELIHEHASELNRCADLLAANAGRRGSGVLRAFADEEVGKFLLLLDVARTPPKLQAERVRLLRCFGNHVVRGLYARACDFRPATYEELAGILEHLRASHYLDGPNDVDWIFRNEIEAGREETLYVDYVVADDGAGWITPARRDGLAVDEEMSAAARLAGALHRLGAAKPQGLVIIAEIWRQLEPEVVPWVDIAARNDQTIERMRAGGLADRSFSEHDAMLIHESWTYPLYKMDLRKRPVKIEDLRETQQTSREWE